MKQLKLTAPVLLVMGKTGSIGGSGKTNKKQINQNMKTKEEDEFEVNEDDEEMADDAMYPVGLQMEGNENDRNVLDDDDNNNPLYRDNGIFVGKDDDEGLYPEGVR